MSNKLHSDASWRGKFQIIYQEQSLSTFLYFDPDPISGLEEPRFLQY